MRQNVFFSPSTITRDLAKGNEHLVLQFLNQNALRNCIKYIFKIKPNETSVLIRVDDIIKRLNCDIKSCISSNFFF